MANALPPAPPVPPSTTNKLFLELKTRGFVGRSRILGQLKRWMDGASDLALLTGPLGIGKTALLSSLVLHDNNQKIRGAHFCRWDDGLSVSLPGAVHLKKWIGSNGPGVYVIDGLQEAGKELQGQVLELLLHSSLTSSSSSPSSSSSSLLISSRVPLKLLLSSASHDSGSVLSSSVKEFELSNIGRDASGNFTTWMEGNSNHSSATLAWVAEKAAGNYFWASEALSESEDILKSRMESGELVVGTLGAVYEGQAMQWWPSSDGWRAAGDALGIVAAVHPSAPEPWMFKTEKSRLALSLVREAGWLGEDGTVQHDSWLEWIKEEGLHGLRVMAAHGELWARCMEKWGTEDYAARRLVYHAVEHGDGIALEKSREAIGASWTWMRTKGTSELSSWWELADDLATLGEENSSRTVRRWSGGGEIAIMNGLLQYGDRHGIADAIRDDPASGSLPVRVPDPVEGLVWESSMESVVMTICGDDGHGRMLASTRSGREIWRMQEGRQTEAFAGHTRFVLCVALSPDKTTLASGSEDKTILLWDTESRKQVANLKGHSHWVRGLAWVDDSTLVSAGADSAVNVWTNGVDGKGEWEVRLVLRNHQGWVRALAVLPGPGPRIASGGLDGVIFIQDLGRDGAVVGRLDTPVGGVRHPISSLGIVSEGRLASVHGDFLRVWPRNGKKRSLMDLAQGGELTDLAVLPDKSRVATGSRSGAVQLWDVDKGELLRTWRGLSEIQVVEVTPEGLVVSGGRELAVWDPTREGPVSAPKSELTCGLLWEDGRVVTGTASGEVLLWDADGRTSEVICHQTRGVSFMLKVKGGLALGMTGASVSVWRRDSESHHWRLAGTPNCQGQVLAGGVVCPDGETLVVWSETGRVGIVSTKTGEQVREFVFVGPVTDAVVRGDSIVMSYPPFINGWSLAGEPIWAEPSRAPGVEQMLTIDSGRGILVGSGLSRDLKLLEPESGERARSVIKGGFLLPDAVVGPELILAHRARGRQVEVWNWREGRLVCVVCVVSDAIVKVLWDATQGRVSVLSRQGGWSMFERLNF